MSRDDSFLSFLLHFPFAIKVVIKYIYDFQTRHTYKTEGDQFTVDFVAWKYNLTLPISDSDKK